MGVGLLMSLGSGLYPLLFDQPFMTGLWGENELPLIGKPGTPLFFDIGVFLVVIGVTLMIVFTLRED
jgi:multicomponent Na+:H+ antiporter subunit B